MDLENTSNYQASFFLPSEICETFYAILVRYSVKLLLLKVSDSWKTSAQSFFSECRKSWESQGFRSLRVLGLFQSRESQSLTCINCTFARGGRVAVFTSVIISVVIISGFNSTAG